MKNSKKINRKHIRYRGTAIVEAAIVMALLILLTLGIMGYGWLFLRAEQVTNAARHAARIAIVDGATTGDVEQAVVDSMPTGFEYDGPTYGDGGINPGVGEPVTVTVTGKDVDILHLDGGGILSIPIPDNFTASVTMAKEGPTEEE